VALSTIALTQHVGSELNIDRTALLVERGVGITMHRARPYDPNCRGLLHRFTLNGEEPITAVAA
jgi:hypothetical protein